MFEALGYRFENDNLILNVLSHANYYPGLVQVVCHHLLRQLQQQSFDPKQCPPYPVTAKDVSTGRNVYADGAAWELPARRRAAARTRITRIAQKL